MNAAKDTERMAEAIIAADGARRLTSPRPWVGSIVETLDGHAYAGATDGRRGPHAEVVALTNAGDAARGATLYTTLEPCSHHGVVGPCADAVIAAGISRCVVAIVDPDRLVAGQGIERLRAAGIDVTLGVGEAEVRAQLAPYLKHRTSGRPYVVLKLAATLDGRTAAPDGTSQWITGPEARHDAHRLRADSDAVLVGAGTVRNDDPSLTVRLPPGEADGIEPLRIVLGHAADDRRIHPCLQAQGELGDVLDDLGRRGVLQLMVEGGATVAHAFQQAELIDRYVIYLAPALLGGDDARPLFHGPGAATIERLWRGRIEAVTLLGGDIRIDLVPKDVPHPEAAPVERHHDSKIESERTN